jgi:biopolymer transport protein TolR
MGALSGRRRATRRKGPVASINVTPFVDVMLVLLIVFMVAAPLLQVGVPVELPQTVARPLASVADPLTVTVRADGSIFVQETRVEPEALAAKLEAIAAAGYEQRIFIRADAGAAYGDVATVMADISTAGFRNLALVTDPDRK